MTTQINIEKLVLHGFSERDAFYVRREVQRSLARLIQSRGLDKDQMISGQQLSAPEIRIKPSARPETTGREIARSIFNGLKQPPPVK
ncbi:MAG: hypothetical protein P8X57_01915 [Cyclobacteriaceae bacterium]